MSTGRTPTSRGPGLPAAKLLFSAAMALSCVGVASAEAPNMPTSANVEPAVTTLAPATQPATTAASTPAGPTTAAAATAPATQPSDEIHRASMSGGGAGGAARASSGSGMYEAGRVVLALGGVIGVILLLKAGAAKFLGLRSAGAGGNRGVRVLSRTMMGPKQQLVLLQVGRKLVLISDSGGQVSTLCEITDPDEVAELAAQASGKSPRVDFDRELHGRGVQYEEETAPTRDAEAPQEGEQGSPELSGLADRIRSLGRQFNVQQ